MEINDTLLKDIHNKQLNILLVFDKICRENGFKYSLSSGTLLGAVRHKGFIPWDDDVDVVMPREDYEQFISVANKILPEGYFLEHFKTNKNTCDLYARLIDVNTTWINPGFEKNDKINQGIFIDIFTADKVDDIKQVPKIAKKIRFYWHLDNNYYLKGVQKPLIKKIACAILYTPWARMLGFEKINTKMDNLLQSLNKTGNGEYYLADDLKVKKVFPKRIFEEYTELPFEGYKFMATKYYDEYLTIQYNDYMTLPPVEERSFHHPYKVIDCNKPFKFYIDKFKNNKK